MTNTSTTIGTTIDDDTVVIRHNRRGFTVWVQILANETSSTDTRITDARATYAEALRVAEGLVPAHRRIAAMIDEHIDAEA